MKEVRYHELLDSGDNTSEGGVICLVNFTEMTLCMDNISSPAYNIHAKYTTVMQMVQK